MPGFANCQCCGRYDLSIAGQKGRRYCPDCTDNECAEHVRMCRCEPGDCDESIYSIFESVGG